MQFPINRCHQRVVTYKFLGCRLDNKRTQFPINRCHQRVVRRPLRGLAPQAIRRPFAHPLTLLARGRPVKPVENAESRCAAGLRGKRRKHWGFQGLQGGARNPKEPKTQPPQRIILSAHAAHPPRPSVQSPRLLHKMFNCIIPWLDLVCSRPPSRCLASTAPLWRSCTSLVAFGQLQTRCRVQPLRSASQALRSSGPWKSRSASARASRSARGRAWTRLSWPGGKEPQRR
jgi:hypothetical protein